MSEQQTEPSVEDQLLDAQMHVGRLQNDLALAKKGIGGLLRWTTMAPAMSGIYLACQDPNEVVSDWQVFKVNESGERISGSPHDEPIGPYFAGPLEIGAPE